MSHELQTFVFFSKDHVLIPQATNAEEFPYVACEMLRERALVLPFTCHAVDSQQALALYHEKIAGNLDMIGLLAQKEMLHVK